MTLDQGFNKKVLHCGLFNVESPMVKVAGHVMKMSPDDASFGEAQGVFKGIHQMKVGVAQSTRVYA